MQEAALNMEYFVVVLVTVRKESKRQYRDIMIVRVKRSENISYGRSLICCSPYPQRSVIAKTPVFEPSSSGSGMPAFSAASNAHSSIRPNATGAVSHLVLMTLSRGLRTMLRVNRRNLLGRHIVECRVKCIHVVGEEMSAVRRENAAFLRVLGVICFLLKPVFGNGREC